MFPHFSSTLARVTPTMSAVIEDIQIAGTISNGEVEPYCCRRMDIIVGTSCIEAVFITVKIIMLRVAIPGVLFFLLISFIAEMPSGVAALPSPSIFAVIFIQIARMAGLSSGRSLNRRLRMGLKSLARRYVRPPLSAIFKRPVQRLIMPSMEIIRLTASVAPDIIDDDKASIFPVHTAQIILIITIAPQI